MKPSNKHSFWAFFCHRLHKLDQLLPHLAQEKPGKIHAFRLEIKKLHALLGMLSFRHNYELETGEIKNLVLPLYKLAGKVRKADLHFQLLQRAGLPHIQAFIKYLQEKRSVHIHLLKEKAHQFIYSSNYPLSEIVCDILHPHDEEGLPICYVQMLQNELEFILHADHQNLEVEEWHLLRKSIKNVLFLYKVDPCFHDLLHFEPKFMHELKYVASHIGVYHDWTDLYNSLSQFLQEFPELNANVNMIRLKYKVKAEIERCLSPMTEKSFLLSAQH